VFAKSKGFEQISYKLYILALTFDIIDYSNYPKELLVNIIFII